MLFAISIRCPINWYITRIYSTNLVKIGDFPLKGQVHCFSMQFAMNKRFLLNPEKKIWHRSLLSFSRKTQKRTFNFEKWRHEPKARVLLITSWTVNRLKVSFKVFRNHGFRKSVFISALKVTDLWHKQINHFYLSQFLEKFFYFSVQTTSLEANNKSVRTTVQYKDGGKLWFRILFLATSWQRVLLNTVDSRLKYCNIWNIQSRSFAYQASKMFCTPSSPQK